MIFFPNTFWPRTIFVVIALFGILSAVFLLGWIGVGLEAVGRLLTFFALFMTAVFGAIGTVFDFKDDEKKVTDWGKTAVFGTLISFLIAGTSEVNKYRKDQIASAARSKQFEQTISEIKRASSRLQTLGLSFTVEFSDLLPSEFHQAVAKLPRGLGVSSTPGWEDNTATACASGFPDFGHSKLKFLDDQLKEFDVYIAILPTSVADRIITMAQKNDWYPGDEEQIGAGIPSFFHHHISNSGINVLFRKHLSDFESACLGARATEVLTLSYDGDEDNLTIRMRAPDVSTWQSNGSIVAASDFKDAKAILWTSHFGVNGIGRFGPGRIKYLSLSYSPIGTSCFDDSEAQRVEFPNKGFFFVIDLSKPTQARGSNWWC